MDYSLVQQGEDTVKELAQNFVIACPTEAELMEKMAQYEHERYFDFSAINRDLDADGMPKAYWVSCKRLLPEVILEHLEAQIPKWAQVISECEALHPDKPEVICEEGEVREIHSLLLLVKDYIGLKYVAETWAYQAPGKEGSIPPEETPEGPR